MIIFQGDREVDVKDWVLAEDLFVKWGYNVKNKDKIEVRKLDDLLPELTVWGIVWKWKS